jgi:hypothetical protein
MFEKPKRIKRQAELIHESEEAFLECERYIVTQGLTRGKVYTEALMEKIAREKRAGRYQ